MNAYRRVSSLRRVVAATMFLTAALMTSFPRTARSADDIRGRDPRDPAAKSLEVRDLPALPADLGAALASPEVTAALGGPADVARAQAVEIGPEHVLAAWARSSVYPGAGVAVARNARGELRVVTVREQFPGTVQVGTGGGTATLKIQPGASAQSPEIGLQAPPTAATPAYWDCFVRCFVGRLPQCATPCLTCKDSGFTQCALCYACLGYAGVYCATSC